MSRESLIPRTDTAERIGGSNPVVIQEWTPVQGANDLSAIIDSVAVTVVTSSAEIDHHPVCMKKGVCLTISSNRIPGDLPRRVYGDPTSRPCLVSRAGLRYSVSPAEADANANTYAIKNHCDGFMMNY